jgi:hypothetical protein
VRDALDALEVKQAHAHQAARIVALVRWELLPEWEQASKDHERHQADTVAPDEWTLYPEPRPDLDGIERLAGLYRDARVRALHEVTDATRQHLDKIEGVLESAWLKSRPNIDPDTMTIAEAKAAEAVAEEASAALQAVALWLAVVVGHASDQERKAMSRAHQQGAFPTLATVRDLIAGRTPERLAAEQAQREAQEAERERIRSEAAESARYRNPQHEEAVA